MTRGQWRQKLPMLNEFLNQKIHWVGSPGQARPHTLSSHCIAYHYHYSKIYIINMWAIWWLLKSSRESERENKIKSIYKNKYHNVYLFSSIFIVVRSYTINQQRKWLNGRSVCVCMCRQSFNVTSIWHRKPARTWLKLSITLTISHLSVAVNSV